MPQAATIHLICNNIYPVLVNSGENYKKLPKETRYGIKQHQRFRMLSLLTKHWVQRKWLGTVEHGYSKSKFCLCDNVWNFELNTGT